MDRVGLGVALAVLVVGLVIGMWRRSSGGRLRPAGDLRDNADRVDPALLTALGAEPAAATLLQFSSAFCAPCRAVRRISADVAALLPGVRHVEVDAERHLDAVRALNVWQTPTLFVLDADGRIVKRATGVPGEPELIAAVAEVLPTRRPR
jgi:thiol-disulfide isomerase/thioredoxin